MSVIVIKVDFGNVVYVVVLFEIFNVYVFDVMGGGKQLFGYVCENLVVELKKCFIVYVFLVFDGEMLVGLVICIEGFLIFVCKLLLNLYDLVVMFVYCGQGVVKLLLVVVED